MTIGSGIAIAGIWVGVGISSFNIGAATIGVAIVACVATLFVVTSNGD